MTGAWRGVTGARVRGSINFLHYGAPKVARPARRAAAWAPQIGVAAQLLMYGPKKLTKCLRFVCITRKN